MKNYLIYYICHVISRGRKFSHISKICYMNYKYYLNQPMQMIERRLNMIFATNSQLIISLNRGSDHPLIRKNIQIISNNFT